MAKKACHGMAKKACHGPTNLVILSAAKNPPHFAFACFASNYRSKSSSVVDKSVFSSRYFTITGVYTLSPIALP